MQGISRRVGDSHVPSLSAELRFPNDVDLCFFPKGAR